MVVSIEARKVNLPNPSSLCSPQISSLLYDPNSLSLALFHSDSTFSLFPSFSPFSSSSLPPPKTLISPASSSACFVPLNPNPRTNPNYPDHSQVAFVTAGPHNGGSKVVLRFFLLGKDGTFGKPQVVCSQNGVSFDKKLGVVLDASHGMKVLLVGSVHYLAMYSASAHTIWVFGVKLIGDNNTQLRLVKCAVIACHLPISCMCISFGHLILGELNGVRVFPLRALVKGRAASRRRSHMARGKVESLNGEQQEVNVKFEGRNLKLPNGVARALGQVYEVDKNFVTVKLSKSKLLANGYAYSVADGVPSTSNVVGNHESVKLRSLKLQQDSDEVGMRFILFNDSIFEGMKSGSLGHKTAKAISIQALSQQKFLILDSNGNLYVLHVLKSGSAQMKQLTGIIQVQQSAVFAEMSANTQTVWISDGLNSVHMFVLPGTDNLENEHDVGISEEKMVKSSVSEVIFMSERIQDMIPLAANTVLLLGQDSLYAYAIS